MVQFQNTLPPNFPARPNPRLNYFSFPNDLVQDGRNFCTQIQFVDYRSQVSFDTSSPIGLLGALGQIVQTSFKPSGGLTLPLPKKINDMQTVTWEAESDSSKAASIAQGIGNVFGAGMISNIVGGVAQAATGAASMAGTRMGLAMNPFLWQQFKQVNFKEHNLSWTFTPNNAQESQTIKTIIDFIKFNSLPTPSFGVLMEYPSIAIVKLYPDDAYTVRFKPCAITSVSVDYTGAGGPSFFKNGAPTVINLTVAMKEIELWTKANYNSK
jgi:hypothetical protein